MSNGGFSTIVFLVLLAASSFGGAAVVWLRARDREDAGQVQNKVIEEMPHRPFAALILCVIAALIAAGVAFVYPWASILRGAVASGGGGILIAEMAVFLLIVVGGVLIVFSRIGRKNFNDKET